MLRWIEEHQVLLYWLTSLSVIILIGTLFVAYFVVASIPSDYFTHSHRPPSPWADRFPGPRFVLLVLKNLVGGVCIVAGLAMLILPGQGLLVLAAGVFLVDFPRKYQFEKWVINRSHVLKAINWLRRRQNRPPLAAAAPRSEDPPLRNCGSSKGSG